MPDTRLYDSDFLAWTQDQAGRLRRLAAERSNVDLDLEHLAEEIEDMGNDTLDKIEGLVVQIIGHLLKLEHCPDLDPRRHWRSEVTAWRNTVKRRAKRSPTALNRLDLDELTEDAVAELTALYSDQAWVKGLPTSCAYRIDQVLDRDWWPANRHGLAE
ncbi:DUF29 domain-containing protein [Azospirillum formosense]|nr:DUF29 domain-containing protein [Azospirillum formosense]MBY3755766.1 DUF29 domain-containing protein [Azospirillum formosense]